MTELSGGQTRSLLIGDAVVIGNSPIILLMRSRMPASINQSIELLKRYDKLFVFVTHDPTIALLSDYRVIMKNGLCRRLSVKSEEKPAADALRKWMMLFSTSAD